MKTKVNVKKAVVWGIVVYIINGIISNILYQNPLVSGIFNKYNGHPSIKPMEAFGGMGNWITLTMIFGTFLIAIFIFLYLILYPSLPGKGWSKGLFFGLMIGFIKAVPEAFNQWMLFVYPNILILIQLINTLISLVIFGLILGVVFEKTKVIRIVE